MAITENAGQALDSSREGIESLIRWAQLNQDQLPVGISVAGAIILIMLGLRALGAWLVGGDPDCTRWRGVIGRVLQKTTILFMIAAALDIVVTYAAVPRKIGRLTTYPKEQGTIYEVFL